MSKIKKIILKVKPQLKAILINIIKTAITVIVTLQVTGFFDNPQITYAEIVTDNKMNDISALFKSSNGSETIYYVNDTNKFEILPDQYLVTLRSGNMDLYSQIINIEKGVTKRIEVDTQHKKSYECLFRINKDTYYPNEEIILTAQSSKDEFLFIYYEENNRYIRLDKIDIKAFKEEKIYDFFANENTGPDNIIGIFTEDGDFEHINEDINYTNKSQKTPKSKIKIIRCDFIVK